METELESLTSSNQSEDADTVPDKLKKARKKTQVLKSSPTTLKDVSIEMQVIRKKRNQTNSNSIDINNLSPTSKLL